MILDEGLEGVWTGFSSADRSGFGGQLPPDENEWFGNGDPRVYRTVGVPDGEPVLGVEEPSLGWRVTMTSEELQEHFNDYASQSSSIFLSDFFEYLAGEGEALTDEQREINYDDPIAGLKDWYSLCGDSPYDIVENGYDDFLVEGNGLDEDGEDSEEDEDE